MCCWHKTETLLSLWRGEVGENAGMSETIDVIELALRSGS